MQVPYQISKKLGTHCSSLKLWCLNQKNWWAFCCKFYVLVLHFMAVIWGEKQSATDIEISNHNSKLQNMTLSTFWGFQKNNNWEWGLWNWQILQCWRFSFCAGFLLLSEAKCKWHCNIQGSWSIAGVNLKFFILALTVNWVSFLLGEINRKWYLVH
jgi:hypothetical protein